MCQNVRRTTAKWTVLIKYVTILKMRLDACNKYFSYLIMNWAIAQLRVWLQVVRPVMIHKNVQIWPSIQPIDTQMIRLLQIVQFIAMPVLVIILNSIIYHVNTSHLQNVQLGPIATINLAICQATLDFVIAMLHFCRKVRSICGLKIYYILPILPTIPQTIQLQTIQQTTQQTTHPWKNNSILCILVGFCLLFHSYFTFK